MRVAAALGLFAAGAAAQNWTCADDKAKCNTCDACCHSYIPAGDSCNQCVTQQCKYVCSNGTCNVCKDCCQSYIPDGKPCDTCVLQKCKSPSPPTPPAPTPAPKPPPAPTPQPTGPGGCIPDGDCLPSTDDKCCSGVTHVSTYCTGSGERCEAVGPTPPGQCVKDGDCVQFDNQTCCSGHSHFSGYCPAQGGFKRCGDS